MPYFRYKAQDSYSQTSEGVVQAASHEVAAEVLADQGLTILRLEIEREGFLEKTLKVFNRVKNRDLVVFARQLSVIVSAAIPLVQGLRILVNQTENHIMRAMLSEVADDVEGGAKLSSALARHPQAFGNFFLSIIRSGETSGKLDEVLNYLADQLERDYDLRSRIRSAMIYPAFIFGGLLLVGALMMIFVVPELTNILEETGAELPITTRILIGVSNFLSTQWWLLGLILIGGSIGGSIYIKTPPGRRAWDLMKLKLPVLGPLQQKIIMVRFSQSLSTLLNGGVVLSRSLIIVSEVVDNVIYQELILQTVREVEEGNPVAAVFTRSPHVPLMVSQMLNLGEKTGRINSILDRHFLYP
jgi:type IV pilus assembly protein PilC